MTTYKHLFFDLDHTLWDTDRNAKESLREIFDAMKINGENLPPFEAFHTCYRAHNERLWGLYSENKIGREAVRINRFRYAFEDFNIYNYSLVESMADSFMKKTPYKTHLIEDTLHVLDQLTGRYEMSIITNGFSESQHIKMASSGIKKYFKYIFISDEIGFNKPDSRIFHHALMQAGVKSNEAIMIGDTYETDILGAITSGIDQVHLTETTDNKPATHRISKLKDLLLIV